MGIKAMTTDRFKESVFKKHGDKVEILSEYNGGTKSINFVYHCDLHGDTYKTINAKNILTKHFQPCDECRKDLKSTKGRQTTGNKEFYYDRLKLYVESKGGTLITPKWTTAKSLYVVHCGNIEHPNFQSNADSLVNKPQWCPYCSGRNGDFQKQISDIIKLKDGTLLSDYKNATKHVEVKCNIHNYTWDIMPLNIKKGRWCPICSLPYSEKVVYDYLINNGYKIEVQYKFNDLISDNKELLKFDFGILDNKDDLQGLIEVDDEEHRYNSTQPRRVKARLRDKEKDKYCINNNIKLFRMEYNNNIDSFKDYNWYYGYIHRSLKDFLNSLNN